MWNFFLKNSKLTKALVVVMIAFGVYSIISLPKESFPEIDLPVLLIDIETNTKDLEKIESFVVRPVESVLLPISEVDGVQSVISSLGTSITITIDPSKDNDFLDADIEKVVDRVLNNNNLVTDYTVRRFSFGEFPSAVLTLGFERKRNDSEIIDITRNRLLDLDGIERVEVLDGDSEQSVLIRKNGQVLRAATLAIYDSADADTIKLAKELEETIEELNHEYKFRVHFLLSENIISQVKNDLGRLLQSGSITVLLVFIVLAIFLGWKSALLASLAIPITYLITFLVMLVTKQTINFLSLFSLLLSLGILIDSSIVIVEAFSRSSEKEGLSKDGVLKIIKRFSTPLTVGTLTTVMVFLPMLFMSGFIGLFIKSIPITVSIVLLVSLFVALAVIPVYAKSFYKKKSMVKLLHENTSNEKNKFTEKYEAFLKYLTIKKKRSLIFLFSIFVLFAASMALPATGALGVEMFQEDGVEYFYIDVEREAGESTELHKDVETILFSLATSSDIEFARVNYGKTGGLIHTPGTLTPVTEKESASISVALSNAKASGKVMDKYRNLFEGIFSDESRVKIFNPDGGTSSRPIDIIISSEADLLRISEANNIEAMLKKIPGIKDVFNDGNISGVINRLNGVKAVHVMADINTNRELSDVLFDVKNLVSELELDKDVNVSFGGEQEEINESFGSLGVSMFAGILAIYLLLLWQFKSYKQPFIILITIPLALIGVFFGLYIIGQDISFPSFIGIVALSGIVVNNAIILLDKINENSQSGLSKQESIMEASKVRLRPILLTAVTTILGILPLAIFDPVWGPLGYTIIFGLAFSTFLTFFCFFSLTFFGFFSFFSAFSVEVESFTSSTVSESEIDSSSLT